MDSKKVYIDWGKNPLGRHENNSQHLWDSSWVGITNTSPLL